MRIHWITFVLETSYEETKKLYDAHFKAALGELVDEDMGGRGYRARSRSNGCVLYHTPLQNTKSGSIHCCLDVSGSACDCLLPRELIEIVEDIQALGLVYRITRIDLAFDECPFTPKEFYDQAAGDGCRSLYKRETLSLVISPFKKKKVHIQGVTQLGTSTAYVGAGDSERFIRCYDERGFTRLEFVCKGDRAQVVAVMLLNSQYNEWDDLATGHLLDYIDFPGWLAWGDFISYRSRAGIKISSARVISVDRLSTWMIKQVSLAYFVMEELESTYGSSWKDALYQLGAARWDAGKGQRYAHIMGMTNPSIGPLFSYHAQEDIIGPLDR